MSQYERKWNKGLLAGMVGGLVGTIVMTGFQHAWFSASDQINSNGKRRRKDAKAEQKQGEDATMKAAGKIAEWSGKKLSHEQKKAAGPLVHYGFGTLQGAMYGTVAELAGASGFLPSLIFGAALFTVADEIAVPKLGLSGKPSETPLSGHLYGLASHLVYGLSTEIVRRGLRAAI
jgi:putative membrane protein